MPFQNLETNAFGLTDAQVRASLPYLSLPRDLAAADLEPHGFAYYAESPPPPVAWDERAVEIAPVDGVQQWTLEPNGRTLSDLKAERLAAVADLRWMKAQSMPYDGEPDAYADTAVTAVTGAVVAAQIVPPDGPTTWQLSPSAFRSWDLTDLIAYGVAIRAYIQALFDRKQALTAAILAAEDGAAVLAIDITAGWPA
ncbi:DUF4376 domain-containing protein [uncultured Brevundimonas sp.]|uniref:DUF4376 domain-containing protein n=1 Tax=uncultured Brevundimonas sp. TaxID=213418 RepID=UPI0026220110|nr:DUF4376 domain-containing protein [uncultured Brevundimonas sp.]